MHGALFFALSPLLAYAQQNLQTPLKEHHQSLIVPLKFSDDRTYTFETALDGHKRLSLKAFSEIQSHEAINAHPENVLISVPLDHRLSGSLALDFVTPNNGLYEQDMEWVDTLVPGQDVPITYVGIRKGAMISMDAYSTRLALETPYISLPNEIYDVLVQATNPTPHQHSAGYDDVVDCSLLERFPDLVLGLLPAVDDEEIIEDIVESELVITPEQYVLEIEEGLCALLVRRDQSEVVLGWAAVRGGDIALDWRNGRTGFGRLAVGIRS